jgi:signal transduction histidine kinase
LDDTKDANRGGTGLGLVISNKIAKRLGSKDEKGIELKSEVGVGSTFFFNIEDKEYTIPKNDNDEESIHAMKPLVDEYHKRNDILK